MSVDIRPACYADIAALSRVLDSEAYFTERFERQKNDRGMLLIAWLDGMPVGDVYLWLDPAEEEDIRKHLPGVALLTHLEVLPEFRNRGIGTKLVEAVEQYLVEKGREQVALAVREDNVKAADLYRRLGYQDWGHGMLICIAKVPGPDGCPIDEPELCHIMVKQLHSMSPSSDNTFSNLAS